MKILKRIAAKTSPLLLASVLLAGCATIDSENANARLENRLDRRNDMVDGRLDRLDTRNEARGERWEQRAEQADRAADARWDRYMD